MRELTPDLTPFNVLLYPTDFNNLKAAIKCAVTGASRATSFCRAAPCRRRPCRPRAGKRFFRSAGLHGRARGRGDAGAAQHAGRAALRHDSGPRLPSGDPPRGPRKPQPADRRLRRIQGRGVGYPHRHPRAAHGQDARVSRGEPRPLRHARPRRAHGRRAEKRGGALRLSAPHRLRGRRRAAAGRRSAFEKWCDDRQTALVREVGRQDYFTVAPLLGYVVARQNEIAAVRIILSGKLNGLPDERIRARLREM